MRISLFPFLFPLVLFASSDVFDGAWERRSSSYSSGVDHEHQHLPQRFHHGNNKVNALIGIYTGYCKQ